MKPRMHGPSGRYMLTLYAELAGQVRNEEYPKECPQCGAKRRMVVVVPAAYECGCRFERLPRKPNGPLGTDHSVLLGQDEVLKEREVWTVNDWGTWKTKAAHIIKHGRKIYEF